MNNFDTNIVSNLDLAAIIAAFISISASVYIFRTTPKYNFIREKYFSLIFPLFELLEPYIFKPFDSDIVSESLSLIKENKAYATHKLIRCAYFCEINLCQENYDSLCRIVCQEYDRCRSRLGLRRRSMWYKIARKQYKNKFVFALYAICNSFLFVVVFLSLLLLLFYGIYLFERVTGLKIFPLAK